jgi:hypothetical protein
LTTPVAFFIFNRPETTERVFGAIREAKPQKLLVVADGPRPTRPGEGARCKATRAVIERVDWECEVSTNYADTNLGCKRRIASGLDWVFKESEEAIILEDDCLPAPSFFPFCQSLLERYRNDERIFLISGNNFLGERSRNTNSYYFSSYTYIWGWASWRRALRLYDVDMKTWPEYRRSGRLGTVCKNRDERKYWEARFEQTYAGAVNSWDYQMLYACWFHDRLAVVPERNLVSNIGFSAEASHLALGDDATSNLPVSDIWEITHPARVERDRWADRYIFKRIYKGRMRRVMQHLKRGYDQRGLLGLGHNAVDLAQRTAKLLLAR